MSKVQVKLNYKGIQELLKGDAMRNCIDEYADRVMKQLDDGYEIEHRTTDRSVVAIGATTAKARVQNSKNNTLLKALGAAKS